MLSYRLRENPKNSAPALPPRYGGKLAYRPDIDGLRAVAVLAVVLFHAFPAAVPGGFVGVDVFFVISGYLISALIFQQLSRGQFTVVGFYARRARRILPALCLVLAACLVFGFYVLLPDEFTALGKHATAAAGFAANIAFWRESGYFAPAAQFEPLLHLWSLGIEEQFYLLWPLAVLIAWRYRANMLLIVGLLSAASLALSIVFLGTDPSGAFYFPLSRFWELGLGCLYATVQAYPGKQRARAWFARLDPAAARRLTELVPVTGLAMIATAVFLFDGHTPFPGMAALLPTLGTLCVIAAPQACWFNRKILAHRSLVFIGLISYPLYLWHWPVLSFANILYSGPAPLAVRAGGVLLSAALAILTFELLELPIRRQRRLRVSLGLVAATAVLGGLGFAVYMENGFANRFNLNVRAIEPPPRTDPLCLESVPERRQFNYCKRTRPDAPEVVFLGDSQAQGVYEGVASVLGHDRALVLLGRGGCPPVLNVQPSPGVYQSDAQRRTCNEAWLNLAGYVRETRPPIVVIVGAGARFFRKPEEFTAAKLAAAEANERTFKEGLTALVNALQPYSHVVYMLEIPTYPSAPSCFLRPVKLPGYNCAPRIQRRELAVGRPGYRTTVREVQQAHPGLMVIDPAVSLCGVNSCSQVSRTGEILYRDEEHLSPYGGRRLVQRSGLAQIIEESTGPVR